MKIIKLLIGACVLFSLGSCQFTEPIDYVLNSKKEGRYAIIYDCGGGKEKQYKDGRLQYLFPENNILVLSYPHSSGITDYRFYYYENGEKIEFFMPTDEKANSSFLAYGPTRIATKAHTVDFFYFGNNPEDKGNKEFFNFEDYVFDYIEKQDLKCGKN